MLRVDMAPLATEWLQRTQDLFPSFVLDIKKGALCKAQISTSIILIRHSHQAGKCGISKSIANNTAQYRMIIVDVLQSPGVLFYE